MTNTIRLPESLFFRILPKWGLGLTAATALQTIDPVNWKVLVIFGVLVSAIGTRALKKQEIKPVIWDSESIRSKNIYAFKILLLIGSVALSGFVFVWLARGQFDHPLIAMVLICLTLAVVIPLQGKRQLKDLERANCPRQQEKQFLLYLDWAFFIAPMIMVLAS